MALYAAIPPQTPRATLLLELTGWESDEDMSTFIENEDQCNIGERQAQFCDPKRCYNAAKQENHHTQLGVRGKTMPTCKTNLPIALLLLLLLGKSVLAIQTSKSTDEDFGPVVRAYLGYLRNEQEVVDDRVSRHEVSTGYYRRNSNRIKALRQMAIRLARETQNDYLPELEAVAADELGLLFERPPSPGSIKVGQILKNKFRFLGAVRSGEAFYVFARLDPYEQAELIEKEASAPKRPSAGDSGPKSLSRSRKVVP